MNVPISQPVIASPTKTQPDPKSATVPFRPLGQILVEAGEITARDKLRFLEMQSRVNANLGDLLVSHGLITKHTLYATIAQQYQTIMADFDAYPIDDALADTFGHERALDTQTLPWMRQNGIVLIATANPKRFAALEPELRQKFGDIRMVIADLQDIHDAVQSLDPTMLIARAESRVPDVESCRAWQSRALPFAMLALFTAMVLGAIFVPGTTFLILASWAIATLAINSCLKAMAALSQIRAERAESNIDASPPIIARLPAVSVLVPLYREHAIAGRLIKRLSRLNYPRELLEICLVVEADDQVTQKTIAATDLPPHIRCISVPASDLKTKPRAMNYALDFCKGSIVGVYDAEDAPAPDQIHRVVARFHERGPDVACVQAMLDFYNPTRNWLSRCFAAEYASWFRVVLPGLARMGLVIPLGGTSLFFRRDVLEKLGGWDAHNVTEDADLGIRLARHGYRTELINSVTQEEANCWFWPWIKQRSRWLKGYMITWAVHTRTPVKLYRDLGAWRFFGVQLLLLGTISQVLLAPFLWSFWLPAFGFEHPLSALVSHSLLIAVASFFVLSTVMDISVGLYAVRSKQHRHLMPWVPTMLLYFPIAVAAAYKGLFELITRPFYWDKTQHGDDPTDPPPPKDDGFTLAQ